MTQTMEKPVKEAKCREEKEEEEDKQTYEELGLDPRLTRALNKKGIHKPTPIQSVAIPLILEGKDVVARAKTGSGKTFAYLVPLLQKLFDDSGSTTKLAPSAFILVPTRELCHQVYGEAISLIKLCRVQLKVEQLTTSMTASDLRVALAGPPDILISTPACIPKCLSAGVLQSASIIDSLKILVLDEADLLLSYGYEEDLKALTPCIPKSCQCLLMSATSSSDVEKLKKLILHNPYMLTLPEIGDSKDDAIPKNVQQFWISCSARDKLLHILSMLKLELVQKKVLIFTNTIDMGFRLRLFLEKFGIRSAILNAELPQNSRLHILEEFNAGLFDYLIATDDSEIKEKETALNESNKKLKKFRKNVKQKLDFEFGVVRGIDFKNVFTVGLHFYGCAARLIFYRFQLVTRLCPVLRQTLPFLQVINFDMPQSAAGYVHRIGRTGRAYNTGVAISLVSSEEMEIFEEIKSFLGDDENKDSDLIASFPLLTVNAVESLRYRAEDVAKSVTKVAVRESRAEDLRNEILNSEKLISHFEANPRDLDLLKHDKVLSKNPLASHLRDVPDYLVDTKTKEASKMIKLSKIAMGNNNSARRHGSNKRFRRSKDPLKTFTAEGPKKGRRGGMKRGSNGDDNNKHKKNKFI